MENMKLCFILICLSLVAEGSHPGMSNRQASISDNYSILKLKIIIYFSVL